MIVGLMVGTMHAWLITVVRLPPFVATLASGIVIRGVALILTQAEQIRVTDQTFQTIARGSIGDVRYTVFIWLGFALILTFILRRTRFGRYVFAAGDNDSTTTLTLTSAGPDGIAGNADDLRPEDVWTFYPDKKPPEGERIISIRPCSA